MRQFRYFEQKYRKQENYLISRNGLKNYQRNDRPLLGEGVQEYAPYVGVGMLDATVCDIYLVNKEGLVVGRPILVAGVDANTSLCLGYSLLWEGGVYSLQQLMLNIVSDKVELCRKMGIAVEGRQWPVSSLPGVMVTDMGSEYIGETFEQIVELGVTVINLPPFRPDLKGPVEKLFDLIQEKYKDALKGKGVMAIRQFSENQNHIKGKEFTSLIGGSDSFTIIGDSGIGKSATVSRVIDMISVQRIIDLPNNMRIIPCIHVQTPADCSIKGLLFEILCKVDEILDTRYHYNAMRTNATADMLIGSVSTVALNHIGLLVVDEIQNVVNSKNGTISTDYIRSMIAMAEKQDNRIARKSLEDTIELLILVELDRAEQERLTLSKRTKDGLAASPNKSGRKTGQVDKLTPALQDDIIKYLHDRSITQMALINKHKICRNTLCKYIARVRAEQEC